VLVARIHFQDWLPAPAEQSRFDHRAAINVVRSGQTSAS
jgi:hypothetical protein